MSELEEDTTFEVDTPDEEIDEPKVVEGGESAVDPQDPADEFAIEIDGEVAEDEPPLVKQLRDEIRTRDRELANYRKTTSPKIEIGEKPTLEGCDFDTDKYEAEYAAWNDRKAAADSADREAQEAERVRNETQQKKFVQYRAAAQSLPVQDFDQAEAAVIAALPEIHQTALLGYTKDTAKVVYALAKHPAKLAELAREPDPIKFVLAVTELERNLKVVNRKKPPAPEAPTLQRGSAPAATPSSDKHAEKLLDKALRTGNMTEYNRYIREKKQA